MDVDNATIMRELLERVRAATGPDRELDADLAQTVEGVEIQWRQANGTMEMYPVQRYPSTAHAAGFGIGPVPIYTASIDAALALAERVLPDLVISMTKLGDGSSMIQVSEAWLAESGTEVVPDFEPLPPMLPALSILAVVLTALIASEPQS